MTKSDVHHPPTGTLHWQMLAVDLDSTLIGRDHKVGVTDAAALQTARSAGMHVAICTGRNLIESAGVIGALGLTGLGVFANGGTIADMGAGRHVACTYMSPEVSRRIIDFFDGIGHAVLALVDHPETRQPYYIRTENLQPHMATVEWLLVNRMHAVEGDVTAGPLAERVVRLGIVVDVPEAAAIEESLTREFRGAAWHHSIYSKHYDCQVIEVFPRGVDKWSGIEAICRLAGLDAARVVTIGDDVNDIAMLEKATLSFAMGNAPEAIRARAKRITTTQEESGVAQVIEGILRREY